MSTPEKAGISWQRKMQTNPAEKKRNVRGSVDPNVSSWDRVKEFKDQCLTVVSGNLRCDAWKETLSLKKEELCQEARIIREAYQITGEHQENQEERSEYQGSSRKNT